MTSVFGVGPPRSGTTMMAECLGVVRETHHQCGDLPTVAEANIAAWRGEKIDMSVFPNHGSEVSCFYTFVADRLEGKVIHLWRPASLWLPSAVGLGFGKRQGKLFPWAHLLELDAPSSSIWDRLAWMYREYHTFLLSVPDTYVVAPDRIVWEDLFDWLGWNVTSAQIREVQARQRIRPGRLRKASPALGPWDRSLTDDIERELDARTRFSREEAIHPL